MKMRMNRKSFFKVSFNKNKFEKNYGFKKRFIFFQSPTFMPKVLVPGSLYCTFNRRLFQWHRCELLLVTKTEASVFYIDIGSTDLIPIKSVKTLKVKIANN